MSAPRKRSLALGVVAVALALPACGADVAAGAKKANEVCAACHGPDGNKPIAPDYPKLGGQYRDYLQKTLKDYKSGARTNPIMTGQAQALTNKEIEDLAAYYASRPSTLVTKR
ncbi:MAG: cytochrome c [Burkholderiales bacterium]|nr:cytochrome c [Burkholderiales bacterium]